MIALEDRYFELPSCFNWPVKDDGISQVINAKPGGKTPVEGLAINDVKRPVAIRGNQNIIVTDITMND